MLAFVLACIHLNPLAIVRYGGYVGIAVLSFAESGILLGVFFPGDSLLFIARIFSSGGDLSFPLLVFIAVSSAIIGDSVGYWFGSRIGPALFKREDSRFFKQAYVAQTQKFFDTYGGRAVVLARFVPMVRTVAPVLAGVGKMKYRRFLSFNAIGGILWGAGMVSLGYFLGSIIPNSEHYILPIALVIIILSFLPVLISYLQQ